MARPPEAREMDCSPVGSDFAGRVMMAPCWDGNNRVASLTKIANVFKLTTMFERTQDLMTNQPISLAPNLVSRPYRGGKRLAAFRNADIGAEERVPEDW